MWSIPGANGQDDGHDMRPQPSQQEQGSPEDLFLRSGPPHLARHRPSVAPSVGERVKHKVVTGPPAQGCVEAGGQSGT